MRFPESAIRALCVSVVLLSSLSAFSAEVPLAWSPSPSTNVAGYYIYGFTNATFSATNIPAIKVDVGTNLQARVDGLAPGVWTFAATAYESNKLESDFSNLAIGEIPEPPKEMRTVTLQFNASLSTTNWQDIGFYRVKIR